MLNLIAAISYFVVLGVSIWVASVYEAGLVGIRQAQGLT